MELNIVDFLNKNYKEVVEKFGFIGSEFTNGDFTDDNGNLILRGGAGLDDDWGIDISFDIKYLDSSDYYYGNEIEEDVIAGKTIYYNNYLNVRPRK